MARISSYPYDITVQDTDAWVGSDSVNRSTKQYTAEAVARYLNTKGKISISAQMVFKYVAVNPKAGDFSGPTDGSAMTGITTMQLSTADVSGQDVIAFMAYLIGSNILISEQNNISTFGDFLIDSYTVSAAGFYTLNLTNVGGNGNLTDLLYYDFAFKEGDYVTGINAGEYINISDPSGAVPTINHDITSRVDTSTADSALTFPVIDTVTTNSTGHVTSVNTKTVTVPVSISGSGTTNFVTKWTDANTIGDSSMFDNGASVGIGTTSPAAKLDVNGNVIITTSGAVNNLLLTSTDTTTAGAPDIVLYADAPAVTGDTMGDVLFQGQNGMVPSSTSPLTYTGLFSKMVDKDNNHSSLVITTHKGNGSGAQALTATFSAKGVNNSATGTLLINPSSVTDVADYNLEVKGDALIQDNFYVNGNVGIGTTSPLEKLEVAGNIAIDQYLLHNGDLNTFFGFPGNDTASIGTNGSERMRITSGGNVGIGTTSPLEKLSVSGNILAQDSGVLAGIDGDKDGFIFHDLYTGSGNYYGYKAFSGGNTRLSIVTDASERLTVLANGNVGIGTTSPAEKLHVFGGSAAIEIDSTTNEAALKYDNSTTTATIKLANNDLKTELGGSEVMRILANGNVGIGTTSPSAKLSVLGTSGTGIIQHIEGSSSYGATTRYSRGGSYTWQVGVGGNATSNDIPFSSFGIVEGSATRLAIGVGGNVGIGTTSPSQKLHVDGNARVTGAYYDSNNSPGTANQVLVSTVTGTDWIDGSAIPGVPAGSGTLNTVPLWTPDGDTLGNSIITQPSTSTIDVDGNILISDTDNDKYFGSNVNLILNADADAQSGDSARNIIFQNRGSEKMRIDADGNVGIGTTSPSYNLVVGNGTTSTESRFYHSDASYTSVRGFGLYMSRGTSYIRPVNDGSQTLHIGSSTNTWGTFSADANTFTLNRDGNSRLYINSSGNVGIGTTSPGAKLDVIGGSLKVSDTYATVKIIGTGGLSRVFLGDTTDEDVGYLEYNHISNYFRIGVNAAERMRIDSSGNVGIGTTSPSAKLHVDNSGNATTTVRFDAGATASAIVAYGNNGNKYFELGEVGSTDPGRMSLFNSGTQTILLRTDGSSFFNGGNVGIGTTSPQRELHVHASNYTDIQLTNDTTGTGSGDGSTISATDSDLYLNNKESGNLLLYTYNSEKMRITSAGNVGIGTTSPNSSVKLQVEETGSNAYIRIVETGNTGLDVGQETNGNGIINLRDNKDLRLFTNGTEAVRIKNTGNVGIGTTNPDSKLEIAGGDVEVNDIASGIIMKSPDGTRYRVTIANGGTLSVAAV